MTSVIGVETTGLPPARYSGVLVGEISVQQLPQRRLALAFVQGFGERGSHDGHARFGAGADADRGFAIGRRGFRLFPIDDPPVAREAAHQMLGALENEIPPQMRETDQRVAGGKGAGGNGVPLLRGCGEADHVNP